jgi:hypothetical protein
MAGVRGPARRAPAGDGQLRSERLNGKVKGKVVPVLRRCMGKRMYISIFS